MASVLLVDDDRALRKLLRAYLEQESISISAARGFDKASRDREPQAAAAAGIAL
jgi:DNA-binding response OmpR family regulator